MTRPGKGKRDVHVYLDALEFDLISRAAAADGRSVTNWITWQLRHVLAQQHPAATVIVPTPTTFDVGWNGHDH
jgi:hypothetical protein